MRPHGALVFLLGSLLAWPQNMDPETFDIILSESVNMNMHIHVYINTLDLVFQGSVLCITGCVCFAFAAFVNGLNIRHFNDVSSQMLSASTSLYMCGALLFVMGSMAFLPDFGCSEKMITLGAWLYTIGSCLYFLGSSISFLRTLSEIRSPVWELVHEDVNEKEMRYSTFSTSRF